MFFSMWRFPKVAIPLIFIHVIFHDKPSSYWGTPRTVETPNAPPPQADASGVASAAQSPSPGTDGKQLLGLLQIGLIWFTTVY